MSVNTVHCHYIWELKEFVAKYYGLHGVAECWQHLAHLDLGKDARTVLHSVQYTITVPCNGICNSSVCERYWYWIVVSGGSLVSEKKGWKLLPVRNTAAPEPTGCGCSCVTESQWSSVPFHLHCHSSQHPILVYRCWTSSVSFHTTATPRLLTTPFLLWASSVQVCILMVSMCRVFNNVVVCFRLLVVQTHVIAVIYMIWMLFIFFYLLVTCCMK